MLIHPTLDLLASLGLHGMAKGFRDLDAQPEASRLEHAEWLGLLLEQEKTSRQQKRFESRARVARLRHAASVEDVDYRAVRGLDRALFLKLAAGDWIRSRHNLLITGPCGVGKSWLSCALGHRACRGCCAPSHASICSSSTTRDPSRSMPNSAATCSKSSRTDTRRARPSSPANCPSIAGTNSSATRPSRTPSSTVSFTMPIASTSRARAYERPNKARSFNRQLDLCRTAKHHQKDPCE
jgi:IstB-like ATP binding protein